jgi:DNA polymerase-3 subunit delta
VAPAFKSAYLIHGDDHGRIAERRARLRAVAESESGASGIELFEGDASTPEAVARALNAMTLALGRRFIVVDGVERWKDKELGELEPALAAITADTTVAFFAREEGRAKAPERLVAAVRAVDGDVIAQQTVKPWELPKWVIARAQELSLTLEGDAARTLIDHVGERQQRLMRELEKLALDLGPDAHVGVEQVLELTAPSSELKAWALADAVIAGQREEAVRVLLSLREQGERVGGLIFWLSARLRQAHRVALAIEQGESQAEVKAGLRMPSRAADKLIAGARRAGAQRLRVAIEETADLELASRGGGSSGVGEDTAALLTVASAPVAAA